MRALLLLIVLLWSAPVFAQSPHVHDVCPASTDTVPAGQTVTVSTTATYGCFGIHGTMVVTGTLTFEHIHVYTDGFLDVRPGAVLVKTDVPLNTTLDPEQFGGGIIVEGRIRIVGTEKTGFVRLGAEPLAGQTTLTLASSVVGWQPGDRVTIPDTRHLREHEVWGSYVSQTEVRTIASVSGQTVTLTTPLQYHHRGARDPNSSTVVLLPHVANLSRSITIRSANLNGTRGHLLATGRADVDIRFARFDGFGRTRGEPLNCTLRSTGATQAQTPINGSGLHTCTPGTGAVTHVGTNHIGRYALHFHHLDGPAGLPTTTPQWRAEGNVLEDSRKWPMAIHNSHYGLAKGNVMKGWEGAGLMTEDGSETGNVIEDNFALDGVGMGGGRMGGGREGVAFYFRGVNNYVRRNVAAAIVGQATGATTGDIEAAYGYKYFLYYLGNVQIPTAKGATTRSTVYGNAMTILEFSDNEVYSADQGLTYWWIGSFGYAPETTQASTFRNTRVWHVFNIGVYHYPAGHITFDGYWQRGDTTTPGNSACCMRGIFGGDYTVANWVLRNLDIRGMSRGVDPSTQNNGVTTIENSILHNATDVRMVTLYTSDSRATVLKPRTTVIRNTRLLGGGIGFLYNSSPVRHLTQLDRVDVENHNGVAGDNFRAYFSQQAPSFVVPQTVMSGGFPVLVGAPSAGMTNAQLWAAEQRAIGGAVAPCTTTRAGVMNGFACGGSSAPPPPQEICGDRIDNDGDGQIDEGCPVQPPPCTTIDVAPLSVLWTAQQGQAPPPTSLTVTTCNGQPWSTVDGSPFYDASPACAFGTCASGSATVLTPNASFFAGAAPGTFSHPITIRSAGLADVTVPVDATVVAPAPPPDADGDGVPDANDKCTNTPSGATVDASGCAAVQRDTDGDGVNDAVDKCSGTLPGQPVDASGCVVAAPPAQMWVVGKNGSCRYLLRSDSNHDGVDDNNTPDGAGSWTWQAYRNGQPWQSRRRSPPYQAQGDIPVGTSMFHGVWTKSGVTPIETPTVTFTCTQQ